MSNSHERLIEKGLELLNPKIIENEKLHKEIRRYISKHVYHEMPYVAVLYVHSSSFCEFLSKKNIDPDEFLGRKELIITDSKVLFTDNFSYTPDELHI